jgi:hypothetical protein
MEAVLVVLAVLAGGMALVTAGLVKWAAKARSLIAASFVLFLIGMMISMLVGALIYFLHPSGGSLVEGLWVASGSMSLSVLPLFLFILQEIGRRSDPARASSADFPHRVGFVLATVGLVLCNEFLMGWVFQLAGGGPAAPRLGDWGSALAYSVDSPWFLFPMALEMAVSAYLLRGHLPPVLGPVLEFQAIMMAFSPTALPGTTWVISSTVVSSLLMFAVFVLPMREIYRGRELPHRVVLYLLVLVPVFGAMLAGLVLWVLYGAGWTFALSVLAQMSLYFGVLLLSDKFVPALPGPRKTP